MSNNRYYRMCCDGIGRAARIRMVDGREHVGIIDRVTPSRVYLRPMGGARGRNFGGVGYSGAAYPFWGWGFGAGIALGAIATLAFIPFFFW